MLSWMNFYLYNIWKEVELLRSKGRSLITLGSRLTTEFREHSELWSRHFSQNFDMASVVRLSSDNFGAPLLFKLNLGSSLVQKDLQYPYFFEFKYVQVLHLNLPTPSSAFSFWNSNKWHEFLLRMWCDTKTWLSLNFWCPRARWSHIWLKLRHGWAVFLKTWKLLNR